MTDTIIKGTGNSRSIKAPANLKQQITDLDSLLDMLIAGFPCDIGPLNEAGCQQIGDALNKANLLDDETAALYGKPATAVPNDILAAIRPLITTAQSTASERARIAYGSFVGTGSGSTRASQTLNFSFKPLMVAVFLQTGSSWTLGVNGCHYASIAANSNSVEYSWGSNFVTISYGYPSSNALLSKNTHNYIAIG